MKESLLVYNLKLNCLIFFYRSKQLTDYIYTDIYCKLSKCIGQTPCSYEHYLVMDTMMTHCGGSVIEMLCIFAFKMIQLVISECS